MTTSEERFARELPCAFPVLLGIAYMQIMLLSCIACFVDLQQGSTYPIHQITINPFLLARQAHHSMQEHLLSSDPKAEHASLHGI